MIRRRSLAIRGVQLLCRAVLFAVGVRRRTIGTPPSRGTLVLANHLSWLDIVVILAEQPVAFVGKHEIRAWPIVGRLARWAGVVFIDRTRRRDLLRSIPMLEACLRRGTTVVLFPEGTTTDGRALRPFKPALVEAAVRAGASVQPLVLRGFAASDPHPLCWIDDESLLANLPRVRRTAGALFELQWLPPRPAGDDRKRVTRLAETEIQHHLVDGALRQYTPHDRGRDGIVAYIRRSMCAATRALAAFTIALGLALGLLYMQAPRYDFAAPEPFRGTRWYNPYGDAAPDAVWWRANLHSHSRTWRGIAGGRYSADTVVARYRRLGTQVIGVSNYMADPETRPAGTLPVYEHGWNVAKAHRLAIGASSVLRFDFPLWGSVHEEQFAIDRLHEHAELVAIVHPGLRHGHSAASLAQLGNYELLEVLNHFLPPADTAWDAALSAGRPVWLIANDDSHDVDGSGETGTNFTRVLATDTSTTAIIEALRAGRAYGVRALDQRGTLHLRAMRMRGDTLDVELQGRLRAASVVGQGGQVRSRWSGDAPLHRTVRLRAVAKPTDGYLRVVAEGDGEWLYTNPVVRWNGTALPTALATVNPSRTVLRQSTWWLAYAWIVLWWLAQLPLRSPWRRRTRTRAISR